MAHELMVSHALARRSLPYMDGVRRGLNLLRAARPEQAIQLGLHDAKIAPPHWYRSYELRPEHVPSATIEIDKLTPSQRIFQRATLSILALAAASPQEGDPPTPIGIKAILRLTEKHQDLFLPYVFDRLYRDEYPGIYPGMPWHDNCVFLNDVAHLKEPSCGLLLEHWRDMAHGIPTETLLDDAEGLQAARKFISVGRVKCSPSLAERLLKEGLTGIRVTEVAIGSMRIVRYSIVTHDSLFPSYKFAPERIKEIIFNPQTRQFDVAVSSQSSDGQEEIKTASFEIAKVSHIKLTTAAEFDVASVLRELEG